MELESLEIIQLKQNIASLRNQIIHHKIYSAIEDIDDLRIFMEYHVFAVWDFMSLLKSLQNNLTCTSVPWIPKGNPDTRYLINEIVIGEESDVDLDGIRKSHFEMYLEAMLQCGSNATLIKQFLVALKETNSIQLSLKVANVPDAIQQFVSNTFQVIDSGKDYLQAAIFTFGREDLIPDMFISMVNDINQTNNIQIDKFKYYLERHIEVDGGHHSLLAIQMVQQLCEKNNMFWKEAEQAVKASLAARIALWDGALSAIQLAKKKSTQLV